MQPQQPQPPVVNKLLGVKIKYVDFYGVRENLLIFGCDIPIPANMNANLNGQFEVTLHTSAGDACFTIMQPMGASSIGLNHGVI